MIINRDINGSMPEWLMGVDCKSTGYAYAGSNPARPTTIYLRPCSSVVEHTLGKGEVMSSILITGLVFVLYSNILFVIDNKLLSL